MDELINVEAVLQDLSGIGLLEKIESDVLMTPMGQNFFNQHIMNFSISTEVANHSNKISALGSETNIERIQAGINAIERYINRVEGTGVGNNGIEDASDSKAYLRGVKTVMSLLV